MSAGRLLIRLGASLVVVGAAGFAIVVAATGIAANASGLADGISAEAARSAGFWVFAGFIPVLVAGLAGAWRFTEEAQEQPRRAPGST